MTEKREHRAHIISRAIESIETKLGTEALKPTVADLVRLLQIEEELEPDQPAEIRVTWVESLEMEPAFKA